MSTYVISCSIGANVRQSVQIKFDDLKLPATVIETLERNNTISLRPNLSNSLKEELDTLRVKQRQLYDDFCIHFGDTHFVTDTYFFPVRDLIKEIKTDAKEANERLSKLWDREMGEWEKTTEGILRPLFDDDMEYQLAYDAYLKFFPTKDSFKEAITVNVVGPLPVSLVSVDAPTNANDIQSVIEYENFCNTSEILRLAKENAADRALQIGAELIDDLDVRLPSKIGRQQTGGDKKRGSWQRTAERLKLIADSVPGFDELASLASQLLETGKEIQANDRTLRDKAAVRFQDLQTEIRGCLESLVTKRDPSEGLEALKKSLSLSSKYKTLCERIKQVERPGDLNLLIREANTELDIYKQRSKHLSKLIATRQELIGTATNKLDELLEEVKETPVTQTIDPSDIGIDF